LPDLEEFAQGVRAAEGATLESIRAAARRVPWVRDATVRRVFPDAVEVTFSAHAPFARWNEGELVSEAGDVFTAPGAGTLPLLRGPDGSARARRARVPPRGRGARPARRSGLRASPVSAGAWQATLASGLTIALGAGDWRPRAERFVRAWPKLSSERAPSARSTCATPAASRPSARRGPTSPSTPTLSKDKEGKP
jgi:cell division protein FtsQ